MVGEDLGERGLVLREQECGDKAGRQRSERIVGRCKDGERAGARQGLSEISSDHRCDQGVEAAIGDSDVDNGADFDCYFGLDWSCVVTVATAGGEGHCSDDQRGEQPLGGVLHGGSP